MDFNLTGHVIEIGQEEKIHCKCVIKDDFSSVIVLVPANLLREVSLNEKVQIWGQLKGFNYKGKIYNNLFAKSLIKLDQLYTLLKKKSIEGQELPQFEIVKYSSSPFATEDIDSLFNELNKDEVIEGHIGEKSIFNLILNSKKLAPYYNAYSTSIEKALNDGSILKEGRVISLSDGSNYFTKNIKEARFVFFGKEPVFEYTEITLDFFNK